MNNNKFNIYKYIQIKNIQFRLKEHGLKQESRKINRILKELRSNQMKT